MSYCCYYVMARDDARLLGEKMNDPYPECVRVFYDVIKLYTILERN